MRHAVLVAASVVATCGGLPITSDRVERSFAPTFANLFVGTDGCFDTA